MTWRVLTPCWWARAARTYLTAEVDHLLYGEPRPNLTRWERWDLERSRSA